MLRLCTTCGLATALLMIAGAGVSYADEAASASKSSERGLGDIMQNYSIRLGIESAGPLRFADTPDQKLETTSVFQYGGKLAFVFGSEHKDAHRLGLGVGHNLVARSESRKLSFTDLYAIYETGAPLVLQLQGGFSIPSGTKALKDEHGGVYGAAVLRYSFDHADRPSAFRVSPGLVAKSYLVTSDVRNSSFFLGAQIEFNLNFIK